MQVARFGGVAEDFGPAGFFQLGFGFDGGQNFLELADDFVVVKGLVEKPRDDVFGLVWLLVWEEEVGVDERTSSIFPFCASQRGVSHRNGQRHRTSAENRIWHATGKRHCSELCA